MSGKPVNKIEHERNFFSADFFDERKAIDEFFLRHDSAELAAQLRVESLHAEGKAVHSVVDAGADFFFAEIARAPFDGKLVIRRDAEIFMNKRNERGEVFGGKIGRRSSAEINDVDRFFGKLRRSRERVFHFRKHACRVAVEIGRARCVGIKTAKRAAMQAKRHVQVNGAACGAFG